MLQQTVIKAVIPVYARFLAKFPDVKSLAAADEDAVREAVRGLGYYRRFRFLHQAAKDLVARGRGGAIVWPRDVAGWRELPGVGDYTAAAVASIAFGAPAAVVDGNVERVFCRLFDKREPPNAPHLKRLFKELATELLDISAPGDANQALMELGQLVCTPTSPACHACPVHFGCAAKAAASQHLAPAAKPKPKVTPVTLRLTVLKHGDTYALARRPHSARFLKDTLGWLTERLYDDGWRGEGWEGDVGLAGEVVGSVKHSITHHKILAHVTLIDLKRKKTPAAAGVSWTWVDESVVEPMLTSNLDRKAWTLLRALRNPRQPSRARPHKLPTRRA